MRFVHAAVGVGLLVALHAGRAAAQGRDAAAADALFREARALLKAGDFKSACPKLAESHRLDPAAGTAINLGDCWGKLGKLADALQSYRDALDLLKPGDHRIGPSKEQIASLEKRVPKLTVKLAPGAPEGTKVKRDDVELGEASLGVALPVNPGDHWVVVVAPGRSEVRQRISVRDGQSRAVVVAAGEVRAVGAPAASEGAPRTVVQAKDSPPSSRTHGSQGDGKKTVGLVLGGVGAAALVFGGVALYQTDRYFGQSKTAADRGDGEAKRDKYAAAETWQTAGIVSLVVGGAAVVTGAVFWFSADGGVESAHRNVRAVCAASPKSGALFLEGTW